jgi:hypothetical protein
VLCFVSLLQSDASVLVGANSNGQVFVFEPGQVCNVHSVTVQITATTHELDFAYFTATALPTCSTTAAVEVI